MRSEVKKLANVEPGEGQKYADALLQDLGHQERCAYSSVPLADMKSSHMSEWFVGSHYTNDKALTMSLTSRRKVEAGWAVWSVFSLVHLLRLLPPLQSHAHSIILNLTALRGSLVCLCFSLT